MPKKSVLLPALAATAGLLLAACGSSGGGDSTAASSTASGSALAGVTLHVGDQKAGVKSLLTAAGELKGVPYTIDWSQFTSGPPLLEALNAHAIDVGGVGDSPPVFAAAAGSKITLVSAYRSGPDAASIVVPKNSTLKTPADLKGKKVAVAKGSSANYHLLAVLKKAGLTFSDITPVYLQPADALAAFSSGSVAAWAIWEPYASIAQTTAGAKVLVNGAGTATGLSYEVSSPTALADSGKAAAISDLLTRIARARSWVTTHQSEWAPVWGKEAGIPTAVAAAAVKHQDVTAIAIDDSVIKTEQEEADAFLDAGLIPKKVDISSITSTRFNSTVGAAS